MTGTSHITSVVLMAITQGTGMSTTGNQRTLLDAFESPCSPTGLAYNGPMLLVKVLAQIQHWRDGGFDSRITNRALRAGLADFLPDLDASALKDIIDTVHRRTPEIADDERSWSIDVPTRAQLEWAASVLAAFKAIRPHVDQDDDVIDFLADALLKASNTRSRRFFSRRLPRALMRYRRRPSVPMNAFLAQYGTPWHWRSELREDHGVNVVATKCFYHGFMTAHGEPELTRAFCHLDTAWTDQLLRGSHGIGINPDEQTTLGAGGERCCFPLVPLKVSAISRS